ncbi:MAG: DUF4922 domain-containing protein [Deltaproteobacteria bacterium]|nr:DUF4922 domain-containing protein [Deltaproteobacteria bacterium]
MELPKKISDEQLRPYLKYGENDARARLQAFIRQQHATWPDLAAAHRRLDTRLTRTLPLTDSSVELQCNPGRTRSTTAKVAAKDVAQRPCFLCPANLYPEQLGLLFASDWLILNNPFPIFNGHMVISTIRHTAQLLEPALPAMISFVHEQHGTFSAFYNGARCGASAPDHLHFQACPAGMLPIERQLSALLDEPLRKETPWYVTTLDNRGIGLCRAASAPELLGRLRVMCARLNRTADPGDEADLNLIIFGRRGRLAGVCLPRRTHRPACFFATGDAQYVISPGAVDVAGLAILPRQMDFERMTKEKMLSIYAEVCLGADVMADCTT